MDGVDDARATDEQDDDEEHDGDDGHDDGDAKYCDDCCSADCETAAARTDATSSTTAASAAVNFAGIPSSDSDIAAECAADVAAAATAMEDSLDTKSPPRPPPPPPTSRTPPSTPEGSLPTKPREPQIVAGTVPQNATGGALHKATRASLFTSPPAVAVGVVADAPCAPGSKQEWVIETWPEPPIPSTPSPRSRLPPAPGNPPNPLIPAAMLGGLIPDHVPGVPAAAAAAAEDPLVPCGGAGRSDVSCTKAQPPPARWLAPATPIPASGADIPLGIVETATPAFGVAVLLLEPLIGAAPVVCRMKFGGRCQPSTMDCWCCCCWWYGWYW